MLSQEPESLPDAAGIPPSPTDLSPLPNGIELAGAAECEAEAAAVTDLGATESGATESGATELEVTELGATELPPDESSATVAWVNRLTSEFEATTATHDRDAQGQQLQEQNLRLQGQNRDLLEQKAILEVTLEETQMALQLQMTRSQNQEILLVQQAQALAESQAQTSGLYRDLELAQQTAQRQQIMIETLTEQLESSQERVAQLEQEVATAQARVNEKAHALIQAEMACRDLKTRLSRQQRYALQFKTALERCLDMPALRRSMVNATAASAEANPAAADAGNLGIAEGSDGSAESDGSGRTDAVPTTTTPIAASLPLERPDMASVDLVEVSSHLHSLLNEAAASSMLDASATFAPVNHEHLDEVEASEDVTAPVLPEAAPVLPENPSPIAASSSDLVSEPRVESVTDHSDWSPEWPEDHWVEATATAPQTRVARFDSQPIAMTPGTAEVEGATTEVHPEDRFIEDKDDQTEDPIAATASPDRARGDTQSASPAPFATDRVQADLWQRLNQWTAASEAAETPAIAAMEARMEASDSQAGATPPETDLAADAIAAPLPAQRGIQPLRPSPQIPKFVSQWSEATGRTAPAGDRPPAAPSGADVSEVNAATSVTSFTVSHRRQEALSRAEIPAVRPQPSGEPVAPSSPQEARTSKRIELPHPQGETAAFATVGQAVTPAATHEDDGQGMANWPSPLVYPLRPAKKRKSLAAIDLPNFARPHS